MPDLSYIDPIIQVTTSHAQTQYTFAFLAPEATDIQVYYQAPSAIPSPQSDLLLLDTDYTVTLNTYPTPGGYITLLFTPQDGWYLTINRQVSASLNTSFSQAQNFNGENLDKALDRLLLLIQQNFSYAYNRNLGYVINTYIPYTQPSNNTVLQNPYTQLPPLNNGEIWQGTGSGVGAFTLEENPDVSTLRSQLAGNDINADGAALIGYYNNNNSSQTNLHDYLNSLPTVLQKFIYSYAADTGTANTYIVTLSPAYTAYSAGQKINVLITNSNTSASCTLNVNGLGAKNITLANGSSLVIGDIVAGMIATFIYNGTNMQLLNPVVARQKPAMVASVYCSTSHTWPETTVITPLFDTVRIDPYGFFDAANNQFIAKYAGKYRVTFNLMITAPSALNGYLRGFVVQNGTILQQILFVDPLSAQLGLLCTYVVNAAANDTLKFQIQKTSSNTFTYAGDITSFSPQQSSDFTIEYLGT